MRKLVKIITDQEEFITIPVFSLKYFLEKSKVKSIPIQKIHRDVFVEEIKILEDFGVKFSFNDVKRCYIISYDIM